MAARPDKRIEVEELRVGMHIHLDLGWMAHPFPVNSFRIADEGQIEQLRRLGLTQVRWSPERSAIVAPPLPRLQAHRDAVVVLDATPAPPLAVHEPVTTAQRRRQRKALRLQREDNLHSERAHEAAADGWREAMALVRREPRAARERSERLLGELLAPMAGERALSVCLLGEATRDREAVHALNVTVIALLMGRVCGLTDDELRDLGTGALLHDVGKLELLERVRHPAPDAPESERELYRQHVARGVAQGHRMALSAGAIAVLAQHHEQADGRGFPRGLALAGMSRAARIVALADRYDRLCNPPPPQRGLTPHEALATLFARNRAGFDAAMLNAFIRMMGVYPPGSLVQLTDGRHALVMAANPARPLKPRVLPHDPGTPREEALLVDLGTTPGLGIRRSLNALQLPAPALAWLLPRQRVAYFFRSLAPSEGQARTREQRTG